MIKYFWAGVVCCAALSCHSPGPDDISKGRKPNVIILLVDALRADRLGCYGSHSDTSPYLDSLSKKGIRFVNAFSQSSHTKLSVAALFTGLIPPANGIRQAAEAAQVLSGRKDLLSDVLSPDLVTLAQVFKRGGYLTFGLITNPHVLGSMGFNRGFDSYLYLSGGARAKLVNQTALEWFESRPRGRPFFVYLHYMDVHAPYYPPPGYEQAFTLGLPQAKPIWKNGPYPGPVSAAQVAYTRALYDAQIRYWDDEFKKFMAELERLAVLDNTIVVVISDHGEEFYDHRGFGHGYTVYDEMIHVPLIMVWPGVIPRGGQRRDLAALIDLFPTLSHLAGLQVAGIPLQGRDLFKRGWSPNVLLSFLCRDQAPPVYAETFQGKIPRCLRTETTKLIFDSSTNGIELYRLDQDPHEKHDLAKKLEARDRKLAARLKKLSDMSPIAGSIQGKRLDQKTINALKSLGY